MCKVVVIAITSIESSVFCCLVATIVTKVYNCNCNHLRMCNNYSCKKKCLKYLFFPICKQNFYYL